MGEAIIGAKVVCLHNAGANGRFIHQVAQKGGLLVDEPLNQICFWMGFILFLVVFIGTVLVTV